MANDNGLGLLCRAKPVLNSVRRDGRLLAVIMHTIYYVSEEEGSPLNLHDLLSPTILKTYSD